MRLEAFVTGSLADQQADAAVVHAAVKALKDEKKRAVFEVYLKEFLMSLDIVLPGAPAQPYRVPARRFGYILQVAKERYKDASLELGDAGEKVKALINAHLISLGINPKVEPVELLAPDFMERLAAHSGGSSIATSAPRLAGRVAFFARKASVNPGKVQVKDLGYRWASCLANGDLHFHWRCLMAPLTVIDYIVVHELCHLRHRDHSVAFWNEVDKVLPDWRDRREWLRARGAGLDL